MSLLAYNRPKRSADQNDTLPWFPSAIETDGFPFEKISAIAERESWRKEVNRPIYHVHKWWAQRLGSVFRSIVIGTLSPAGTDVLDQFYSAARFPGKVVFDPFMGSGTTLGEALKLGCDVIGRDINPVAYFLVRNALEAHSRERIIEAFETLDETVRIDLEQYYRCRLPDGSEGTVLYFFWVKVLPCPECDAEVQLRSSQIFAQHAYPKKHPESRAVCPHCGEVNSVRYDAEAATCRSCHHGFAPRHGPAKGSKAECPHCSFQFPIAATARSKGEPPAHRLYAKLVLAPDGTKHYLAADEHDLQLFDSAASRLKSEGDIFPIASIQPGYNTNQALSYGYKRWDQMFNERQLLSLGLLGRAISAIPEPEVRDALACLFSGTLEFNNMFASYKGEGTGAVRHMFAHHILKPERTPLEANVWGTPKSSGSFSGLFRSRLMRALDYAADPFELRVDPELPKVFGLSEPMGHNLANSFKELAGGARAYVSCGDSAATDLPDESVDVIITDPPFFDNVNYSQLADFFHVWQRHILGAEVETTRSEREVQHSDADIFATRLGDVFRECARVLKPNGILAFSYHHSRSEGWSSVAAALASAGFSVSAAVPIKSEMSGATPKNQAKEPIDLDIIIVCRRRDSKPIPSYDALEEARRTAALQVARFGEAGRRLSRNDVRVIVMGQFLKSASISEEPGLMDDETAIEELISSLHITREP